MSDFVKPMAEWCAATIETLGIAVIAVVAFYTVFSAAAGAIRKREGTVIFRQTREHLGRGILLGLEFLVAADIIHTVAVDLTFGTIGVLAIVVLIRTFLSFTLELEVTGKFPWQAKSEAVS